LADILSDFLRTAMTTQPQLRHILV
jgi:hypothetical protein